MSRAKKVTLADDDPGILDAVGLMLELEGFEVTSTLKGHTILDFPKQLPDIYVLDIWMSGSDGRELCKFLKNDEKTKNIPVILISASNDLEKSAELAGADDFLAKPFEMDALIKKINNCLQNS